MKRNFDSMADDNYSQGRLADDLADIYKDLKKALELLAEQTDESIQEGLWNLRFSFGTHWGIHAVSAIRFLHFVRYEKWYRHL